MIPVLALLVAAAALQDEPAPVTPGLRTVPEAVEIVEPQAKAWAKDAALMKVTLRTREAFDARPEDGMYSLIDLVYASRAECKPGEIRTRTWSFSTTEPALRASEPAVTITGTSPLPDRLKNVAGTVYKNLRNMGMTFDRPLLELARVHGVPVWYTINPAPEVYIADGLTGRFRHRTRLTVLASTKSLTTVATPWKQALSVISRDLKAWGVGRPQVSTVRGTGQQQTQLTSHLGVTTWEFTLLDPANPEVAFYVVVANGDIALWARQSPPSDRAHVRTLSSWSLTSAPKKVAADPKVKDFLKVNRAFQVEFEIDFAGMKAGQARYRIMPQGRRQGLEVTLDRRGSVKGVTP